MIVQLIIFIYNVRVAGDCDPYM